jgi:OOP family OmpA-OmpF porin
VSRKFLLLTPAILVASASGVLAQPVSGLYIGGGIGWNYLESRSVKNISTSSNLFGGVPVSNKNFNYGSGIATVGSVGWGFGNGLRSELEGNFRWNSANQNGAGSAFGSQRTTTNGNEYKAGLMANVLYDFVDAFGPGITPYAGGGIGWQWIDEQNINTTGTGAGPAGTPLVFRANNAQSAFAYQAIFGVSYALTSVTPGLALTTEYRFLGTAGNQTYGAAVSGAGVTAPAKVQLGAEANHAIMLGIRYAFNYPAPPPPLAPTPVSAPAPAPSRTYLVFFDWDRAELTQRARQVIAEAAQNSTRVQYTRIQVNGHTDLSGTAAYNQRLSVRRAQAVAAELVHDGVPQGAISAQGFGESNPLVPTAQGVREPQNRRVEIILQ